MGIFYRRRAQTLLGLSGIVIDTALLFLSLLPYFGSGSAAAGTGWRLAGTAMTIPGNAAAMATDRDIDRLTSCERDLASRTVLYLHRRAKKLSDRILRPLPPSVSTWYYAHGLGLAYSIQTMPGLGMVVRGGMGFAHQPSFAAVALLLTGISVAAGCAYIAAYGFTRNVRYIRRAAKIFMTAPFLSLANAAAAIPGLHHPGMVIQTSFEIAGWLITAGAGFSAVAANLSIPHQASAEYDMHHRKPPIP